MRNRIALLQQQELKAQKNILYARKKAQFLLKQKQEREANLFRVYQTHKHTLPHQPNHKSKKTKPHQKNTKFPHIIPFP